MTLPSSEEDQDPRQRKPRKVMARLRVSLSKTEEPPVEREGRRQVILSTSPASSHNSESDTRTRKQVQCTIWSGTVVAAACSTSADDIANAATDLDAAAGIELEHEGGGWFEGRRGAGKEGRCCGSGDAGPGA
eukprot:3737279-Rhodomonas_salina.2